MQNPRVENGTITWLEPRHRRTGSPAIAECKYMFGEFLLKLVGEAPGRRWARPHRPQLWRSRVCRPEPDKHWLG